MRLALYQDRGARRVGVATGQLDDLILPTPWRSLTEMFALGDPLAEVRAINLAPGSATRPSGLLAPVVERCQLIGTGGNYADHAAEAATALVVSEPVFIPYLWSAVTSPGADVAIPTAETFTDYEGELAIVIGRTAFRLDPAEAMNHVFGYTIVNDVSAREVMAREPMQVMLSKSPDTFLPVGPCITTADEIGDPHGLSLVTYVNGEIRQKANTRDMLVRVPELLARITRYCTLHPGDVVTTGTPGGVGYFRTPPEPLRPGDTVTVEIEGIGQLTNRIVAGW